MPGQHPGHSAFVDAARERILVGALKINFYQLIVFEDRHFGFVAIGGDHQFLAHDSLPSGREGSADRLVSLAFGLVRPSTEYEEDR